jgi:hypothetical protein
MRIRTLLIPVIAGWMILTQLGCSAPEAAIETGHPMTIAVRRGIADGKQTFDHGKLDKLLRAHVDDTGMVDYTALATKRATLREYLGTVAETDLAQYGRDELLALLINAYNGYTLDWIVENLPLKSIRDTDNPWKKERHLVGGHTVSLDFIEHKILRVTELFDEPRVHFGVNCASKGCPPLRNRAYTGAHVGEELEETLKGALTQPRQLRVEGGRVRVNQIFSWFGDDFRRGGGTLAEFLALRAPEEAAKILREKGDAAISYIDYDWSLNSSE